MAANDNTTDQERRKNPGNRDVFEKTYDRVEPFLDPDNSWAGQPLEQHAYNVLKEKFPNMTEEELNAHLAAAQRVFKERSAK